MTTTTTPTTALAALAAGASSYETAWRSYVAREEGANGRMRDAESIRRLALAALALEVGTPTALAIDAALRAACARVAGTRPDEHREGPAHADQRGVAAFIRDCLAEPEDLADELS